MIGLRLADFWTRAPASDELATARMFVYVDDVNGHCAHTRSTGATIVSEPMDQGPTRIYIASDCGAHQWIFARPV